MNSKSGTNQTKSGFKFPSKMDPLQRQECEFARRHKNDTDEELLEYLKACAKKLGRRPKVRDVVGYAYIKRRLGAWPRILERAGLKEKSEKQIAKEQKKETARRRGENKKRQAQILRGRADGYSDQKNAVNNKQEFRRKDEIN